MQWLTHTSNHAGSKHVLHYNHSRPGLLDFHPRQPFSEKTLPHRGSSQLRHNPDKRPLTARHKPREVRCYIPSILRTFFLRNWSRAAGQYFGGHEWHLGGGYQQLSQWPCDKRGGETKQRMQILIIASLYSTFFLPPTIFRTSYWWHLLLFKSGTTSPFLWNSLLKYKDVKIEWNWLLVFDNVFCGLHFLSNPWIEEAIRTQQIKESEVVRTKWMMELNALTLT